MSLSADHSVDLHVETSPNDRYIRYNAVLGRGSYKTVYKAFDTEEALEVAWNKLHVDRLSQHDLEKVSNEVSLLRQVEHKNIIHFYDTWPGIDGNGNQTINFITEQMMSGTLKEYLKKAKAIKLKVIRRWCANILEAIAYLHSQTPPIMHRDLKCDNIFINGHVGEVKIGDLGLSGVKEREKADSVIGTPEFMAPELYEESYTEKVDIYAFGMCLLEIVSMEYPYSECNNMAQIFKKVFSAQKPNAYSMLVDCPVKDVIAACLEREEKRPSAIALLQHPLFSEWEKDDGRASNLSLVKGNQVSANENPETSQSASMPIGTELIDWSDPLKRNVLVSMLEGEKSGGDDQQVSVKASRENGGFYIGLEIPIRDAIKRVEFNFNPFEDSTEHIALEMVSEFGLAREQEFSIRREIDRQVQFAKEQREALEAASTASRNATPQPSNRVPDTDHAMPQAPVISTERALSPPSISPTAELAVAAPHAKDQIPSVGANQQSQGLVAHSQSALPNGTAVALNVRPIAHKAMHQHVEHRSGRLTMGLSHNPSEVRLSDLELPEVPASPMDVPPGRDGMPPTSSFISSQAQSVVSADTPSGVLSPGTGQELHVVSQTTRHPSMSESGIGVALHDSQIHQAGDRLQNRMPVDVSSHDTPVVTAATADHSALGAVTIDLVTNVEESTTVEHKPVVFSVQEPAAEVPNQNIADGTQTVSKNPNFTSLQKELVSQGENVHPGGIHPQSDGATQSTHSTEEIPRSMEKVVVQEPILQSAAVQVPVATVSTLGNTGARTFRQESASMRHFPQSASDGQLPLASKETLVDVPPGPPSTPITPAASGLDISEDHQTFSAMTNHPYDNFESVAVQQPQQPSPKEQTEYSSQMPLPNHPANSGHSSNSAIPRSTSGSIPHRLPRSTSGSIPKALPRSTSGSIPQALPRSTSGSIPQPLPRSTSGSIPQIVVVGESSKCSSAEKARRNLSEFPSASLPSFASGELPPNAVYYSTQGSGIGRGISDQVDSSHVLHSQGGMSVERMRKDSPRPQQRNSPGKSQRTESWKSLPSDDSMNNMASRISVGNVTGVDYDQKFYILCLSLMDHCAKGSLEDVKEKLDAGADPQFADYDMRTPLHIAATEGHERICAFLLERGARVGARDRWANTALGDAIDNGHKDVQQLLKAHGAVYEKRNSDEMLHYELMRRAFEGDLETVRAQIVAGADVTRCDYDRRTPLHLACSEGHTEVAELLLVNGASSEVRDRKGRSPVDDAINNGHRNILRVLRQYGAVIPRHLFEAQPELGNQRGMDLVEHAARGRLDAVKQAIGQGADPNFKDYDNRTALHLACVEGRLEIARALLKAGAAINVNDRWGSSPKDEARKAGFGSILDELALWESKRKQQRQSSVTSFDKNPMGINGHNRSSLPLGAERIAHFDQLSQTIASSVSMGAIPTINLSADDFAAKYPSSGRGTGIPDSMSSVSLPPALVERADDSISASFDAEQRNLEQEYNSQLLRLAEKRRMAMDDRIRRTSVESVHSRSSEPLTVAIIGPSRQVARDPAGSSCDMEQRLDVSGAIPSSTSYSSLGNGSDGHSSTSPRRTSMGPVVLSTSPPRVPPVQVVGLTDSGRENPDIRMLVDTLVDVASRQR